jgi:hypothetical protein
LRREAPRRGDGERDARQDHVPPGVHAYDVTTCADVTCGDVTCDDATCVDVVSRYQHAVPHGKTPVG